MEIANLLNYRFSTLKEFSGLQQTNKILPKNAPRKCSKRRYITTKEKSVLIDLLHTNKPLCSSKIPDWAKKDAKEALVEPLCFLINQFITKGKLPFKSLRNSTFQIKEVPTNHTIIVLFLPLPLVIENQFQQLMLS